MMNVANALFGSTIIDKPARNFRMLCIAHLMNMANALFGSTIDNLQTARIGIKLCCAFDEQGKCLVEQTRTTRNWMQVYRAFDGHGNRLAG